MANEAEQTIGYDARELWLEPPYGGAREGGWTPENKAIWLLRNDIQRPLSTDYLVWGSVFDVETSLHRPHYYQHTVQFLWEDLSHLMRVLGDYWKESWKHSWIIAITVVDACENVKQKEAIDIILQLAKPFPPNPKWDFLGYDVSDRWLLSGLSNCTHNSEPDFATLRERYGPYINRHHLFDSLRIALEFREISDSREADHAPFLVFGIWLVEDTVVSGKTPQDVKGAD